MRRRSGWYALVLLGACASAAWPALALEGGELAPIVVTATRLPQSSLDLPVSIDRIDQARLEDGQLQVNLSESLDQVPGLSVENRQNYAQDLQLSVRGFGARSSFGVRGVRLYSDGIPGTMPDGQGQFSQFDLGSAGHIEVMRGPFSALYGNSSGGVIALFTQDGPPGSQVDATVQAGSLDTRRVALKLAGSDALLNYVVDAAHFQTEGYRDHSAAERENFNARLRFDLGGDGRPDPGRERDPDPRDPGSARAHERAAGRGSGAGGHQCGAYNTRKSLNQEQGGAVYERLSGARTGSDGDALCGASRDDAVPGDPGVGGGHTDQSGRRDRPRSRLLGRGPHVSGQWTPAGTTLRVTAGISYDRLERGAPGVPELHRRELGVEGALRRDERNRVVRPRRVPAGAVGPGRALARARGPAAQPRQRELPTTSPPPACIRRPACAIRRSTRSPA